MPVCVSERLHAVHMRKALCLCLRYQCLSPYVCRSERESLETSLFEVQQQLAQVESRREQLETEIQSLRLRSENATGEWNTFTVLSCAFMSHIFTVGLRVNKIT